MKCSRLVVLVSALVACSVHATDIIMAGGAIGYRIPDSWVAIMETQGDPEARVFQVPDPSPSAATTLARVSVTVKQVDDANAFQQYVQNGITRAKALTKYASSQDAAATSSDHLIYTAQEGGEQFSYYERYWLKGQRAIQLRCVRPAASKAGSGWSQAFDKGCEQIAAQINL